MEASALGLFMDAAGSLGFGAFWNGQWCVESWHESRGSDGMTKNIVLL